MLFPTPNPLAQRLLRQHKEALAALDHAHACSNELRRQIDQLSPDERETAAVRELIRAVDASDVVYAETLAILTRGVRPAG